MPTRESSAWYEEFRAQEAELKAAPQRIEVQRATLFKTRCQKMLDPVQITQGKTREPRKLAACFDETLPKDHGQALYLWMQTGWQTEEKSVIADARAKGADHPTLFLFLPREHSDALANALVTQEAARNTLTRKGAPNTEEGRDAQRSMESQQRTADQTIAQILDRLFSGARLFQAGGQEITEGNTLVDKLTRAAQASVSATSMYGPLRMYLNIRPISMMNSTV